MKIILASNSPRRKELLGGLGVDFEVKVLKGVDESYPDTLPAKDVAEYIATEKAAAYTVQEDELLITADTVVIVGQDILGKPKYAALIERQDAPGGYGCVPNDKQGATPFLRNYGCYIQTTV